MLAAYRDTIGNAARLIARAARYPLTGGQEAAELARELAKMAYIEEEIDRLCLPRRNSDAHRRLSGQLGFRQADCAPRAI